MASRLTLDQALSAARETRGLEIGPSILDRAPDFFRKHFGNATPVIVADTNTFHAAGRAVAHAFRNEEHALSEPFIFEDLDLYADQRFVERLESSLREHRKIPIAVGSGTINDLVKLAAHRTDRQYLCIATAASMDGYTAFGASITDRGSKQTFECPAPLAVLADLDVIAAAPSSMKAWGYADLMAKVTAGADWIVADLLGIESIDSLSWNIVQGGLREALADPDGVRRGDRVALGKLVEGLMLGGFAMQAMRSSRPASGAEHQFSHLWDMQHHLHAGQTPSHGQKVGIGTLAVTALYERLLAYSAMPHAPSAAVSNWPSQQAWIESAAELFSDPDLQRVATREIAAKYIDSESLFLQLDHLRRNWDVLRYRLQQQLIPFAELRSKLAAVGAPFEPEQIGISRARLRRSFRQAFYIRRRFTILDLVARMGLWDPLLDELFHQAGVWSTADAARA